MPETVTKRHSGFTDSGKPTESVCVLCGRREVGTVSFTEIIFQDDGPEIDNGEFCVACFSRTRQETYASFLKEYEAVDALDALRWK